VRPKRRHLWLAANMLRVTRDPRRIVRGTRAARRALRAGAMQKLSEAAPFLALVGEPGSVLEIGAGAGGMLAGLCAVAADDATIVSVDLEGGPFGSGASDDALRRAAQPRPGQTLHLVRGDSQDDAVRRRVADLLPRPVDVLLIDGDHTYEGVRADFEAYRGLVAPHGLIAFHDILEHPGVPDCRVHVLWRALAEPKLEIVSPRELRPDFEGPWGGIGVIRAAGPGPAREAHGAT
jgi:predicted O-methyltransferase YrrM